jgi:nucleotide-binding universal stress UspA family protein
MAIDTILLAVGRDDADRLNRLVEETVDVAGPTGAKVVLVHVFTKEEYDDSIDKLEFDTVAEEVGPDDVARRHSSTRQLAKTLDEADVDYEIRGAVGEHGEEIVKAAKETDADRVMVGGRKRSPTGKAVFGSTAQEVMLSSPCPVTFVRADTK